MPVLTVDGDLADVSIQCQTKNPDHLYYHCFTLLQTCNKIKSFGTSRNYVLIALLRKMLHAHPDVK